MRKVKDGYKRTKASDIAEVLAVAYANCTTQQERQLLADLVYEIGKLVTNDPRQFALEVLDRTAGKLPPSIDWNIEPPTVGKDDG